MPEGKGYPSSLLDTIAQLTEVGAGVPSDFEPPSASEAEGQAALRGLGGFINFLTQIVGPQDNQGKGLIPEVNLGEGTEGSLVATGSGGLEDIMLALGESVIQSGTEEGIEELLTGPVPATVLKAATLTPEMLKLLQKMLKGKSGNVLDVGDLFRKSKGDLTEGEGVIKDFPQSPTNLADELAKRDEVFKQQGS